MSLFKTDVLETHKGEVIQSWLPTQDSDEHYPLKDVVLIIVGESGYHETEWKKPKDMIIENNLVLDVTDDMRKDAESFAVITSSFITERKGWKRRVKRDV